MMLTKKGNMKGIFIPFNKDMISRLAVWTLYAVLASYLIIVVWNFHYSLNMAEMSQVIIDSYISTGDKMSDNFYGSLVAFEKDNLFSSGWFIAISIFALIAVILGIAGLLLEQETPALNEIFWLFVLCISVVLSFVSINRYGNESSIEKANSFVMQSKEVKDATIESLRRVTCYTYKHGKSCTQQLGVTIEDQTYELTTSKVDFYKVGQSLKVTKETYFTKLTRTKKVNIVFE